MNFRLQKFKFCDKLLSLFSIQIYSKYLFGWSILKLRKFKIQENYNASIKIIYLDNPIVKALNQN